MVIDEDSALVTRGEVFDADMIEVVRDADYPDRLLLWYSNGKEPSIAARVERNGIVYQAPAIDPNILREMSLPTRSAPYGSVRELLNRIEGLAAEYCGLENEFARSVGRFVLGTWIVETLSLAPWLRVVGPETAGGVQLFQLLGGFCRHPIRLAVAEVAGICSLPPHLRWTLLIRQPELSVRLQNLLDAMRRRGEFIPRGRRLLNLHGAVATYSRFGGVNGDTFAGIEIPAPAFSRKVEILNEDALCRITDDLQAKLLQYRFEVFGGTPDDADLQAEVVGWVARQDDELRSERWTDLTVIVLEALLGFIHESELTCVYLGQIAKAAEAIFLARGENREVEPRAVGERLRWLGFTTEPRDSRGIKLMLTAEVCRRVHERARSSAAPAAEKTMAGCIYCDALPPASAA